MSQSVQQDKEEYERNKPLKRRKKKWCIKRNKQKAADKLKVKHITI